MNAAGTPGQAYDNALSERVSRRYKPEGGRTGAAILDQTLNNHPVMDASAMLQPALCMVIVMGLAGCGSAIGSARDDPQQQMEEPTCYRDTKSEYEAAGASQSPNAGLLNIGASLAAKDNGFGKCVPAAGERSKIN
jgi:hypothetical protein